MPRFCDLIAIDDFRAHQEQIALLHSLMPKNWRPPEGDGGRVSVDAELEGPEEIAQLMVRRPKGKQAVLSKR